MSDVQTGSTNYSPEMVQKKRKPRHAHVATPERPKFASKLLKKARTKGRHGDVVTPAMVAKHLGFAAKDYEKFEDPDSGTFLPVSVIQKVADFTGYPLKSSDINQLAELSKFKRD
jgi:hypothetical protein